MRTLDELRTTSHLTPDERDRANAFYCRLGRLGMSGVMEDYEPTATWSRASQVARTWRTYLAWHLANALGWRHRASLARGVRAKGNTVQGWTTTGERA